MDSEKRKLIQTEYSNSYSTIPDIVVNSSDTTGDQPEITYECNGVKVARSTQDVNNLETKVRLI